MRLIAIIGIIICLASCTSVSEKTRLSYTISASEYNTVISNYYPRPTYTSLEQMSDGNLILTIEMTPYSSYSPKGHNQDYRISFLKSEIPSYLGFIEKYESWQQTAINRGDAFTKEIGRAKTWGQTDGVRLKFEFHSGNSRKHFLILSPCAVGTCLEDNALVFDTVNVKRLKQLLVNWQNNKINTMNINSVYQ